MNHDGYEAQSRAGNSFLYGNDAEIYRVPSLKTVKCSHIVLQHANLIDGMMYLVMETFLFRVRMCTLLVAF
jgi:hypothetical protein